MKVLVLGSIFFLVLGTTCSPQRSVPKYDLNCDKPADQVTVSSTQKISVFNISSESGIGSARIKVVEGAWSDALIFRLHLKGLEGFEISNGKDSLTVSSLEIHAFHDDGRIFNGKYLMENKGFYELTLPKSFSIRHTDEIEIHWIDFYR